MFTQCPECHHTQTLTIEQLRESRGMIRCSNCATPFDALKKLSDTPVEDVASTTEEALPWTHDHAPQHSRLWALTALAGFIVLCAQIIYFEGPRALQNEKLRPWFIEACSYLACKLPSYRNLNDFSVLDSSLTPTTDKNYFFRAVINNQAEYPQNHPGIKLTLLKLSGEPFVQRAFAPETLTYRTDDIAPHETFEIGLAIAAPHMPVGGYTFELI